MAVLARIRSTPESTPRGSSSSNHWRQSAAWFDLRCLSIPVQSCASGPSMNRRTPIVRTRPTQMVDGWAGRRRQRLGVHSRKKPPRCADPKGTTLIDLQKLSTLVRARLKDRTFPEIKAYRNMRAGWRERIQPNECRAKLRSRRRAALGRAGERTTSAAPTAGTTGAFGLERVGLLAVFDQLAFVALLVDLVVHEDLDFRGL